MLLFLYSNFRFLKKSDIYGFGIFSFYGAGLGVNIRMPCLSQSCRASRQSMILLGLHNTSFDSNLGFWRCDRCKCLVSTACVSLCCIFWYCTGVSTHLHAQTGIPIYLQAQWFCLLSQQTELSDFFSGTGPRENTCIVDLHVTFAMKIYDAAVLLLFSRP